MIRILTFLTALSLWQAGQAQQAPQYSLHMFHNFAFNPARAGLDNSLNATGVYRKQWNNLDGGPETQVFSAQLPLYFLSGGMGVKVENETIGSWRQTAFSLAYSWHRPVGQGLLAIGGSAALSQYQLDGSRVKTPGTVFFDEGDPASHNDPMLDIGNQAGTGYKFDLGIYYQNENLQAGISVNNLVESQIAVSNLRYTQARSYVLAAGYRFNAGRHWSVWPSLLLKTDIRQTQTDFSVLTGYNENIFVGASFRGYSTQSIDAVSFLGVLRLSEKISAGFAYDLGLSALRNAHSGTFEILLNYNLGQPIGKGRPPAIIYNPRSL